MIISFFPECKIRLQNVKAIKLNCSSGLIHWYHDFVNFFPRPDPDYFRFARRIYCFSQIHNIHTGKLGNKQLTPHHLFKAIQNKIYSLFNSDPETGHARVCNGEIAILPTFKQERYDTPPAAHDISISYDT